MVGFVRLQFNRGHLDSIARFLRSKISRTVVKALKNISTLNMALESKVQHVCRSQCPLKTLLCYREKELSRVHDLVKIAREREENLISFKH